LSLDAGDDNPSGEGTILDLLGVDDENLATIEVRESIRPLLDALDAREKRILTLRFFRNMTQAQIAEEIGISQMHVSRLLTRTLDDLRQHLYGDGQ
jgi:RNA polymerase sigma-B factor